MILVALILYWLVDWLGLPIGVLAINGCFEGFGPTFFVDTAADGGYGMGYIGTEIAYTQSGYEVEPGVRWSIRKERRR